MTTPNDIPAIDEADVERALTAYACEYPYARAFGGERLHDHVNALGAVLAADRAARAAPAEGLEAAVRAGVIAYGYDPDSVHIRRPRAEDVDESRGACRVSHPPAPHDAPVRYALYWGRMPQADLLDEAEKFADWMESNADPAHGQVMMPETRGSYRLCATLLRHLAKHYKPESATTSTTTDHASTL